MSFDPQMDVLGQVVGSATDRLGHRTLTTRRDLHRLEAARPTPWILLPYMNGWHAYSADYRGGEYRKLPDGTVQLRGLIAKAGGNFVVNEVIFKLPVAFAPVANSTAASAAGTEMLSRWMMGGGGIEGMGRIHIFATGEARLLVGPANPVGWINLNAAQFSTI